MRVLAGTTGALALTLSAGTKPRIPTIHVLPALAADAPTAGAVLLRFSLDPALAR